MLRNIPPSKTIDSGLCPLVRKPVVYFRHIKNKKLNYYHKNPLRAVDPALKGRV